MRLVGGPEDSQRQERVSSFFGVQQQRLRTRGATYASGNGAVLANQGDGRLVIYGLGWVRATGTSAGPSPFYVQDDGNAVLRHNGAAVWSTYTNNGVSRLAPMGAVAYARKQVGKRYVYRAAGPNAFDCSGLTWSPMARWVSGWPTAA